MKRMNRRERVCSIRSRYEDDAENGDARAKAVVELCDCLDSLMASGGADPSPLLAARNAVTETFPEKQRGELQGLLAMVGDKLMRMGIAPAHRKAASPPPYYHGGWSPL